MKAIIIIIFESVPLKAYRMIFILLDNETERMKTQNANGFAYIKGTIENWECSIPKSKEEQQKSHPAFLR